MRRRMDDDSGVSLIIVLLFMLVVSFVALGLLQLLQTSFDASKGVRAARQSNYAADSATELAISNVVHDATGDLGGQASPPCSFTLTGIDGTSSAVTCAPYSASDGSLFPNHARNAIQVMSTAPDALSLSGNKDLTVHGKVYSHGDIGLGSGAGSGVSLTSNATIRTEKSGGICNTARVTATRGKFCASTAATSQGVDPGWTTTASHATALADVTKITCDTYTAGGKKSGGIVTFPPGRYIVSPSVLLATTPSLSSCNADGATLYFPPGTYYLETAFSPNDTSPARQYDVVAGQAAGSWLSAKHAPADNGSDCDNGSPGAHFVLGAGGAITLQNLDNTFTLCAGPAGAPQPSIAVYATASAGAGTVFSTADKPSVFLYGAVYAPSANLALTMHLRNQTYFVGGIVANQLAVTVNASSTQTDSPFSLPDCSSSDPCLSNRRVVFKATLAGSPTTVLTSVVQFDDDFGNTPGKTTTLQQWAVER